MTNQDMAFARYRSRTVYAVGGIARTALAAFVLLQLAHQRCLAQPAAQSSTPQLESSAKPVVSAEETRKAVLNHEWPRLVVLVAIDQLRCDYLTRFSDQFLPAVGPDGRLGGFRLLLDRGAFFADAHYSHIPTFTGPGHATILTGATLGGSGIISNNWLTSSGLSMYCVEDEALEPVGAPRRGLRKGSSSPANLLCETVGDVLRLSNNRHSKVVGIAIKDRTSILLTGHNPTACVWYDDESGNWITSSYYTTGTLPSFAERANRERVADQWAGTSWSLLLEPEAYRRSAPQGAPGTATNSGVAGPFPKQISPPGSAPDKEYWKRLSFTPFGNEMVLKLARMALDEERLGDDKYPDLLCLNFSSNDYAGHSFGPHSPEVQDMTLRTDRALSSFFNDLKTSRAQGLDDVLIVITGDHGGPPIPEWARDSMKLSAGRVLPRQVTQAAEEALQARFPDKDTSGIITGFVDPYLSFNLPRLNFREIDAQAARQAVAHRLREIRGVFDVFTRDQFERNELPNTPLAQAAMNGFHPERSGDLMVIHEPFWYPSTSPAGMNHGSGYAYDTHIPIVIAGPTIRPGFYTRRVDARDIAPTLSMILGILPPSSSSGHVLSEALK